MNLFDFNTQQSAFDENKAKSFINRGKELGKTRDEIKSAYDRAKADGLFNTTQESPSRLGMGIEAGKEAFSSGVNKTQSGFGQISQAFQPETSIPRNDYQTQTVSPNIAGNRDISNRISQFGRGLANIGGGAIETIFGTALGPVMGALSPEISSGLQAISNTKAGQETAAVWNSLSPEVKEGIINVTDMVGLKGTSLTAGGAKTIIQDIAKKSPELLNNVGDKIGYAAGQAVGQPITLAKKGFNTSGELLSKGAKKALPTETVTRTIPEKVVSGDLGFTPTERENIANITGKSEAKYILDKGLAGKGKEELAQYFTKQARDNYKGIDTKLTGLKDAPEASKVTTDALEDILEQLTSSNKFKKAFAEDIQSVKDMLSRGKYTLLEKHRIRQAFDKINAGMYTAKGKAKSGVDNMIDVKIRKGISNELQKGALKEGIDIKAMNNELRAGITMKDALLRRLSQEEKNNFLGLQDIGVGAILSGGDPFTGLGLVASKKYLEGIAPSLSQRLYNLNKTKNVSSRMTRGNPITNTNKSSELGLVTAPRSDLASKPLKKTEQPVKKEVKKPKPLKPTSKFTKAQKAGLSKNKSQAQKQITKLEKEIKTAKSKGLKDIVKELTKKLKVFVDGFVEGFKEKPKILMGDITGGLATRVGQGIEKGIEKTKGVSDDLIKEAKKYKSADEFVKQYDFKDIGEGNGRIVYDMGDGNVIKVASNENGIIQNNDEFKMKHYKFMPKILEKGDDYIIMEKVDVPGYTNQKVDKVVKFFRDVDFDANNDVLNNKLSEAENIFDLEGLSDFNAEDILFDDLGQYGNWGIKNGKLKIIDGGIFGRGILNLK